MIMKIHHIRTSGTKPRQSQRGKVTVVSAHIKKQKQTKKKKSLETPNKQPNDASRGFTKQAPNSKHSR